MTVKIEGFRLERMDTLFFRDGRPFDAANRVASGLPNPQTLAGALRTALLAEHGFDFKAFSKHRHEKPSLREALEANPMPSEHHWIFDVQFRGPWPAKVEGDQVEPLIPVPENLLRAEGEKGKPGTWHRSKPLAGDLARRLCPGTELLPVWSKAEDADHPGGFLTLAGVKKFLADELPTDDDWCRDREVYSHDARTGIQIEMHQLTAETGQIYGINLLALQEGFCFYAEIVHDGSHDVAQELETTIPFGGEGHYVQGQATAAVDWPVADPSRERSVWLLASPGVFAVGDEKEAWQPDALPGDRLVSAVVGKPLAVSGWDVARSAPRPTKFAAPAGSIYFVDGRCPADFKSMCGDETYAAEGWGYALQGVWNLNGDT